MNSPRPIIGFTLDHETKPTYSKLPWYAIRENYFTVASGLDAVPIGLPHELGFVEDYLKIISGLVIIGGDFDIPPHLYGDTTIHEKVTLKEKRTAFEWAITKAAIEREMPILGICGGQQLLNVVLGGTLIQHIPDAVPNCLAHEQPNPRNEVGHSIRIASGTQLHQILGKTEIGVNSAHHQAVAKVGKDCIVSATAPDGVIEAIELPTHPFCLGVQWHPEYHVTNGDDLILEAFIDASKRYQAGPS